MRGPEATNNRVTGGYDAELFSRVIAAADSEPAAVFTVLRWRGFLCVLRAGRVYIAKKSPAADLLLLRRAGIALRPCEPRDGELLCEIVDAARISEDRLRQVFCVPPENFLTWAGVGPKGEMINPNWSTFRRLKFGAALPVRNLDCGVALLVKTLPLLGLLTSYACAASCRIGGVAQSGSAAPDGSVAAGRDLCGVRKERVRRFRPY